MPLACSMDRAYRRSSSCAAAFFILSQTSHFCIYLSSMTSPVSWTLFASNEEAWASMLADCAKAEKSIVLEQFIFSNDEFGRKLIDICAARALAGVKVRFLWDAAGSFT